MIDFPDYCRRSRPRSRRVDPLPTTSCGERCLIIARLPTSPSLRNANLRKLVATAARVGADAVRLNLRAPALSAPRFPDLVTLVQEFSLDLVCPVSSRQRVDLLAETPGMILEIPPTGLRNTGLLAYTSRSGLPVILSADAPAPTVLAGFRILTTGAGRTPILKSSAWEQSELAAALRLIAKVSRARPAAFGFADFSTGLELSMTAVRAGASVIEKPLSLSTPDLTHSSALAPPTHFAEMVRRIRFAESLRNGTHFVLQEVPKPAPAADLPLTSPAQPLSKAGSIEERLNLLT